MKIQNTHGLEFGFLPGGAVKSINAGPIRISLREGSPFGRPGTDLFLRKRGKKHEFTSLFGHESLHSFLVEDDIYAALGSWQGIDYAILLMLSKKSLSWQFLVELIHRGDEEVELDLVHVQEAGLKPVNAGLINEYYVAQYLERTLLHDPEYGEVACCRQNMKEATGHPWLMLACRNGAVAASTDGMQFYGRTYRGTGIPEGILQDFQGGGYAGESPVFALQEKPFLLAPGQKHQSAFFGTYLEDHPMATSRLDLLILRASLKEFSGEFTFHSDRGGMKPAWNLFNTAALLPADDLEEREIEHFFGKERRHGETENGQLLSFFYGEASHVVLRRKELLADRPHAHIMQSRKGFTPDEHIVSTTAFAFGVFHSHISQGNTNFNVLLSVCTSPFNQVPSTGQRIFVEIDGRYHLLGVPSAFEMGLNHCRWIYRSGKHLFQVRSWTTSAVPQVNLDFQLLEGEKVRLLVTHDVDPLNGWTWQQGAQEGEMVAIPGPGSMVSGKFPQARFRLIARGEHGWAATSGDEALYHDGLAREGGLLVLHSAAGKAFSLSFIGELDGPVREMTYSSADQRYAEDLNAAIAGWRDLSQGLHLHSQQEDIQAIGEILPWYGMNALTHFLTPYGLEQFSGAAWGTRDVSQGPVELLLTMEKYTGAKQVLLTLFSNQNPDGGWPQWWMFDSFREIRAGDSHGDVFYWCLIALGQYIRVTGDLQILDEPLPYYDAKSDVNSIKTPLREHVSRLIRMIVDSFIPGTALVPFGGGDWNDSLQPVSHDLARRMISSWTVEMNYQAFMQYSEVYALCGETEKAEDLAGICARIREDFNRHLVREGVVAGYGLVEEDGRIGMLLHPTDRITGIRYSLLPMERGILSGIFSKEQVLAHQLLIEQHLKGPDGARLMDRPLRYKGGIQEIFQRAESSTFFGREIGLMYIHEHIRYAESLAITGQADAFLKALRQAIPVGYRDIVPCGDIRQANCYYSSSDVHFRSRYEADELYDKVLEGRLTLRGGWRVYSSGPGIYIGLIITRLLGIRAQANRITFDPVLSSRLDGLTVSLTLKGREFTICFNVRENSYSPTSLILNGKYLPFQLEEHPYRKGGAWVPMNDFLEGSDLAGNLLEITL